MPFKLTPGLIVVALIGIIAFVGIIAAVTSSGGPRTTSPAGMVVVTVRGDIGVESVVITNLNTGNSIVKTSLTLPYSFNVTKDSSIQFILTTKTGFMFNAWTFQTGTFDNHNPLTIKVTSATTVSAETILQY